MRVVYDDMRVVYFDEIAALSDEEWEKIRVILTGRREYSSAFQDGISTDRDTSRWCTPEDSPSGDVL